MCNVAYAMIVEFMDAKQRAEFDRELTADPTGRKRQPTPFEARVAAAPTSGGANDLMRLMGGVMGDGRIAR